MRWMILLMILLLTGCGQDTGVRFGLISDIQSSDVDVDKIAEDFSSVDAVIIAGDLCESKDDRDDYEEIVSVLDAFEEFTVFVIPGNHETKEDYYNAVNKFDNVIDLSVEGNYTFEGINIIGVPGYYLEEYVVEDGFLFNEEEIFDFSEYVSDGVDLIVSHGPPYGVLDEVNGMNVGSNVLREFIDSNDVEYVVFGHIHEDGGKMVEIGGKVFVNTAQNEMILEVFS